MIVAGLLCQVAFYLTLLWYGEMTDSTLDIEQEHTMYECTYCAYYGDEFTGTSAEVREHALAHPINVDPVRI
jgi:hypothetical protein